MRTVHTANPPFCVKPKIARMSVLLSIITICAPGQKKGRFGPEEDKGKKRFTEDQEEFFCKFSPELAKQCRDVFSNTASKAFSTGKDQPGLMAKSGLQELPVIMMLLKVTANAGQKIGTLIDFKLYNSHGWTEPQR